MKLPNARELKWPEPHLKPPYRPCADNSKRPVVSREARDVQGVVQASTPEVDDSARLST
jgi:hypothetical protein